MPYLFEDDDFKRLYKVVEQMVDKEGRMSLVEQHGRPAALLFLLERATKVHGNMLHAMPLKESDKPEDAEGEVIAVTETFNALIMHFTNEHGGVVMSRINGLPWFFADEMAPELCGLVPTFLKLDDERPIREQINARYVSGWHPFKGFKIKKQSWTIQYKDDPDMQPLGGTALRGEILAVYPHGWCMVVSPDNSIEMSRLD